MYGTQTCLVNYVEIMVAVVKRRWRRTTTTTTTVLINSFPHPAVTGSDLAATLTAKQNN